MCKNFHPRQIQSRCQLRHELVRYNCIQSAISVLGCDDACHMAAGRRRPALRTAAARAKDQKQEAIRIINRCLESTPVSLPFAEVNEQIFFLLQSIYQH